MESSDKNVPKSQNTTQNTSYNPWNLFFNGRKRTESETSVASVGSIPSSYSGYQVDSQRRTSKNEEYLWMMPSQVLSMRRSLPARQALRRRPRSLATPLRHHRRSGRDMAHLSPHLLWLFVIGALAEPVPAPGRVPKVYNALITSNQNLEPSKAYPVYQPVLHDPFAFPYQPVFYGGDLPLGNGFLQPLPSKQGPTPPGTSPPPQQPSDNQPAPENPPSTPEPNPEKVPAPENDRKSTPPPPPPNTESPIPLNQFGLPAQVLPLGRINPAYDGFTQVGPYTYTYPGFRFYDPYDPFSLNPYARIPPLYNPLTNVLSVSAPSGFAPKEVQSPIPETPKEQAASPETPPPEPSDLNVLNYASKDPAIPNVPPPPLPQGGLKSDKSEQN